MTFQKVRFIVGLGNPGPHYERTRHNIGRKVIDLIRSYGPHPLDASFLVTKSFMNSSGKEIKKRMDELHVSHREMLIVLDDFEIPLGRIRIRLSGSDGGHNGLKSILEELQTRDVPRLRIGIGPVPEGDDPADFVLEPFSPPERRQLPAILEAAEDAVEKAISQGVEPAMNQYNNRVL